MFASRAAIVWMALLACSVLGCDEQAERPRADLDLATGGADLEQGAGPGERGVAKLEKGSPQPERGTPDQGLLGKGSGGSGGALGDSTGPCPSCRIHVPPSYAPATPMPLLVALHGDEGRDLGRDAATAMVINAWKAAADQLGFIVLAPACPSAEGCNGAWSDWLAAQSYQLTPATLAWLDAQVDTLHAKYNIALSLNALAGYSGGSYWLSYFAPARASRYSGVAYVAGGMSSYHALKGCPTCKIPGYFLLGDQDPRTTQAKQLAQAFTGCGQEATTDLVTGGHQATIESLTTAGRAAKILTWLKARPLACP